MTGTDNRTPLIRKVDERAEIFGSTSPTTEDINQAVAEIQAFCDRTRKRRTETEER